MDFLIYSRAVPALPTGTPEDLAALTERHWSYMDDFAAGMTARGPTLGPDRDSWTGSMHVVALADPDAARAFVEQEPYQQAGLFADHSIWRFGNLLGRTMWEFEGESGEPTYLLLAHGAGGRRDPLPGDQVSRLVRDRLVLYGALRTIDEEPAGLAVVAQAASREALDVLLQEDGLDLEGYAEIEAHDWEFGGRR
jgi:uncharacterized protein YciI